MRKAEGAHFGSKVCNRSKDPPETQEMQYQSNSIVNRRTPSQLKSLSGFPNLLICIMMFGILASVTDAAAVRIQQALMDMLGANEVSDVHDVEFILYRDQNTQPEIEWQENQCFKLIFDSPYTVDPESWAPFDSATPPACTLDVRDDLVSSMECWIGNNGRELNFKFLGIVKPNLTQILFVFSNFKNPWSTITVESMSVNSYDSPDCSGSVISNEKIGRQEFYQKIIPDDKVEIISSSDVLGDSAPQTTATFSFTPTTTMSVDGTGTIIFDIPKWYRVQNKQNMMYDEQVRDVCKSSDMDIIQSRPDIFGGTLRIQYENMPVEKRAGVKLTIVCPGFKNPIYQALWEGFRVTTFDSEPIPNQIDSTGDLKFDARNFKPAKIQSNGLTIEPDIFTIQEKSIWVFSLTNFPVPLETECYIKFVIPPDLEYQQTDIEGRQIFQPNDSQFVSNQIVTFDPVIGTTVMFRACFKERTVGPSPSGRLEVNRISTPKSKRDTGAFYFSVYKDAAYSSMIAWLENGIIIPAGDLETGLVLVSSIIPDVYGVQIVTTYTITFTYEHNLYAGSSVQIEFPTTITLPATGSTVVVQADGATTSFFEAETGTIKAGNVIRIDQIFGNQDPPLGGLTIVIKILGMQNPPSSLPAGNVKITTYLGEDSVDEGTSNGSFTPISGNVEGKEVVVIDSVTSGTNSEYKLVFIPESSVPKGGFIYIYVPVELTLRLSETTSGGVCLEPEYICLSAENNVPVGLGPDVVYYNIIIIKVQETLPKEQTTTIVIVGIDNPRTDKPTGAFVITTFDDQNNEIDSGFKIITQMKELSPIDGFLVRPSSDINGELNVYEFQISTKVNILDGDYWVIEFPPQVILPDTVDELNIIPVPRTSLGVEVVDVLEAEISGQVLTITYISVAVNQAAYHFRIENIQNPYSTEPSDPFVNVVSYDKDRWRVQWLDILVITQPIVVINSKPALIDYTTATLYQRSKDPLTSTLYEIKFIPKNPIPVTGVFHIQWPAQIHIPSSAANSCIVNTNKNYANSCTIPDTASESGGTITVANVFSQANYRSEVTVTITGVINPPDNKNPGQGFVIRTYTDITLQYQIDELPKDYLVPTLFCNFPCRGCEESDKDNCASCYVEKSPQFDPRLKHFFRDDAGKGHCYDVCPPGYTRDGEASYICIPCDNSCATCKDEDRAACIQCAPAFPFKLAESDTCLPDCGRGYYPTQGEFQTCSKCDWPCADCNGEAQICTECFRSDEFPLSLDGVSYTTPLPALFNNQCIPECPAQFVSQNGRCIECEDPCGTCKDLPSFCLSCNDESNKKYLYAGQCYEDCPGGTSNRITEDNSLICVGCTDPACDLCDSEDTEHCLRCTTGLYVHEKRCLSACPDGWNINEDGTACVTFSVADIGCLPFPFLIAALIGCLIACCGKLKKKKIRNTYVSTQNTITCCIIIIAFIQFLAMISLVAWAYFFDTKLLLLASLILLGLLVVINISFQFVFTCTYSRMVTPVEKWQKYKDKKLTKAELGRFIHPSDELFYRYSLKHKCFSYTIAVMTTMCTFKCNKSYYSHFYSFDMFKARWSNGKYYRKMMTIFTIVEIVIDALIICICIANLLQQKPDFSWENCNMLLVILVEVLILSLFLIILGCIELYRLKHYLRYNDRKSSQIKRFDVSSVNEDFMDKKDRKIAISKLLNQVRTNQDKFLNNKLDDLLNMFGDRHCKSMIELGTGWDQEEDPRAIITWPLSPNTKVEYDGEYHFTKEDMIGGFDDNCYADVKVKDPVHEMGVQGDQPEQDFIRQLNRKTGDLLASTIQEEDELLQRKAKGKRRGRINKYYAAIDKEDDEEADGKDEASVVEESDGQADNLAIIREQEEEEEQLRVKVEEERIKQQQAQANRRTKLAEAERMRLDLEAKEEEARRLATLEEERLRMEQEKLELEQIRELEITRQRLALEEMEAKKKAEADDISRQKELATLNEANRAKYEAEEAARRKALEEEQERLLQEKQAQEKKMQEEVTLLNSRKQEESARLQIERDEEELRLRKLQLEAEERTRVDQKESERIRIEQEAEQRRLLAIQAAEEKRAIRDEEERIKREEEEKLRQKRIAEEEQKRQEVIRLEDELRQKRITEEDQHRRKLEEEDRLHRERMAKEDAERKARLDQEEKERLERLYLNEESAKARIQQEETLRLEKIRIEEEFRLEALRVEEETRLLRIEEEEESRRAKDEAERLEKQILSDRRAHDREDDILAEKQQIEDEKARLASLKLQQEAEQAEIARKQEERRLNEAREIEERIERERLEREALDRERADLTEKQKLAEAKLQAERDELERARLLKEAEDAERKRLEDEAKIVEDVISEKKLEDEDDVLQAEVVMSQEHLKDFNKQDHPVEMPPNADNRTFNVNDILGELDRDDRGNIIVLEDSQGNPVDKTGQPTNERGYLQDPATGDILENYSKQKLFDGQDMDERGEVPAPFCVEKFNFNPHDLMGDLDFQLDQRTGRAIPQLLQTKQNFYVDKKGRRVNRFGWLVQGGNGHVVDKHGRKKFDRKQLDDGDVPKLLNYGGKRFDIKDVMGVFEKDANGVIIVHHGEDNKMTDNLGRAVNEKGYLISANGDVVDREGKRIFQKEHLKNGEFPKIFLFTKFNIDNITGDFEMSPLSEPILEQDKNGNFIDRKGRLVNPRGYLIDPRGNVIDKRGKPMFDKIVLAPDGEIPKIFRMQMLKTDSGSSLSRLMDEIEKNQPSDQDQFEEDKDAQHDPDTSVDSAMEDTPANYNIPNQRFDDYEDYEAIPEESDRKHARRQKRPPGQATIESQPEMPRKKTKKRSKKKKKAGGYLEYLMPTNREVNMADAYGGMAKGQFRRNGVKYDKDRLMNRIKTPADIPGGKEQLEQLAATVAGFHKPRESTIEYEGRASGRPANLSRPPKVKRNQFMGDSEGHSQMSAGGSRRNQTAAGHHSRANLRDLRERKTQTRQGQKKEMNDGDFEKMFGKDIDQYLEGSDFDLDELDNMSQYSRGTGANSQANQKLKVLEKQYLKRIESTADGMQETIASTSKVRTRATANSALQMHSKKQQKSQKKPPAFREFQDRFVDQPDFIHRGEILEFETAKQQTTSSQKKKISQHVQLRGAPGTSNFDRQSRQ